MTRAKHTGDAGAGCPACVTLAELARMPWQSSYLDVLATGAGDEIRAKHAAAVKRASRNARAKGVPFVDVQHETQAGQPALTLSRVVRVF